MAISKLYIMMLLTGFMPLAKAQPGFNIIKDLGWPNNHYRDMAVDNDTLVCYGLAANSNAANWRQGLLLSKFDSLGNHLFSNLILDSLGGHLYIDEAWGKITITSDGGYALTAAPVSRQASLFIKRRLDSQRLSNL